MKILRSPVWGLTRRSTRRYFWRGRGSIALMLILALSCAHSSQAQGEEPYPITASPTPHPPANEPAKKPSSRHPTPSSPEEEEEVLRIEPTASPTSNPTAEPTLISTVEPTENPTTGSRTGNPTSEPASNTTTEPTMSPMPEPVFAPVYTPTTLFAPTSPVEASTQVPGSESPSVSEFPAELASPTSEPTSSPTSEPTLNPTSEPTSSPTSEPTSNPTSEPKSNPTFEPTLSPMPEPAFSPVYAPTTVFAPTGEERTEPSIVSDLPVQVLVAPVVEMIIGGIILPLSNTDKSILQELTSESIADSIIDVLGADQIDSLSVDVSIISPVSRKLRGRSRNLVETQLTFSVEILMQSLIETHDVDRYIFGAFNDDIEKTVFIEALQATEAAAFAGVDSVSVTPLADDVPGQGRTENLEGETTNGDSVNYIAIVVPMVVVVAAAGIGLAAFFVFKGRSRSKVRECVEKSHRSGSSPQFEASDASIEIQVHKDMGWEISTLGDSLPPTIPENEVVDTTNVVKKIKEYSSYDDDAKTTGNDAIKRDKPPLFESIADDSSFDDYDFQQSFCGGAYTSSMVDTMSSKPTTMSSVSNEDNLETHVFLEDDSDSFEIEVPPGLLGLVLVDSEQGVSAVHMIKSSSPLAGQVQKGDRLVGVDGKNVALMWATDVSRLVARKKNKTRRLLFSRPLENQFEASGIQPKETNLLKRSLVEIEAESDVEKEYVA